MTTQHPASKHPLSSLSSTKIFSQVSMVSSTEFPAHRILKLLWDYSNEISQILLSEDLFYCKSLALSCDCCSKKHKKNLKLHSKNKSSTLRNMFHWDRPRTLIWKFNQGFLVFFPLFTAYPGIGYILIPTSQYFN